MTSCDGLEKPLGSLPLSVIHHIGFTSSNSVPA